VITADIPLAADVIAKGGEALDPRGELHTEANIGQRLAMRNLIDQMRGSGEIMRGPTNFTANNRRDFANALDRWLTRALKVASERRGDAGRDQETRNAESEDEM
jgi:uncharacterized protein